MTSLTSTSLADTILLTIEEGVTIYDSQTRSQLQTNQPLPTVGSQTGITQNGEDDSFDIYFAPELPEGVDENNWLQTIPGKSWLIILRIYAPRQEWIDKTKDNFALPTF